MRHLWLVACVLPRLIVGFSTVTRDVSSARAKLLNVLEEEVLPGRFVSTTNDGNQRIDRAVTELESSLDANCPLFPRDLMTIDGVWRLKYTNNALRPPPREVMDVIPSFGSSTAAFQKIDVMRRRVVNVVRVDPPVDESLGETLLKRVPIVGRALSTATVRIDLDHSFAVDGEDRTRQMAYTNRLAIQLERVSRKVQEGNTAAEMPALLKDIFFSGLDLDLPEPVVAFNSILGNAAGQFDTTYCDEKIRISRGVSALGRRELRVFYKCDDESELSGTSSLDENDPYVSPSPAQQPKQPEVLPSDEDYDDFLPSD